MNMTCLRRKAVAVTACIFSLLAPVDSSAGFRSDHFVAWVNLGEGVNGQRVSKQVNEFANSDHIDTACGIEWVNNDSILYFNNRRLKIPDDLIRKAFVERDSSSFPALSRALRSFRDSKARVYDGLDGIIFYDGEKSFRMMSFTVGARRIKTYPHALKASSKSQEIERAFCSLLPPITRAP